MISVRGYHRERRGKNNFMIFELMMCKKKHQLSSVYGGIAERGDKKNFMPLSQREGTKTTSCHYHRERGQKQLHATITERGDKNNFKPLKLMCKKKNCMKSESFIVDFCM